MSRDTDAPEDRGTPATIRLRKDRFELMTNAVGATTRVARSELIGVDVRTITRAVNGIVGEAFMAKTVAALRRHRKALKARGLNPTLDDLFEVVDIEAERVAA